MANPWRSLVECIEKKIKTPGAYYVLKQKHAGKCQGLGEPADFGEMRQVLDGVLDSVEKPRDLYITCDNAAMPGRCVLARPDDKGGVTALTNYGIAYCDNSGRCWPGL